MPHPLRIAVLASGRGSNLAALLAARERGELAAEFVLVASDKSTAGALRLAEDAGIPTLVLDPKAYPDRRAFDLDLFGRLAASGAELVVLAGFMRILDGEAIAPWGGRMLNIHPSLLPSFPGLATHRQALAAGVKVHGATVHFVTAELDHGPIVAQAAVPVLPGDTEDALAERILVEEHKIYPQSVRWFVEGRLSIDNGLVSIADEPQLA